MDNASESLSLSEIDRKLLGVIAKLLPSQFQWTNWALDPHSEDASIPYKAGRAHAYNSSPAEQVQVYVLSRL